MDSDDDTQEFFAYRVPASLQSAEVDSQAPTIEPEADESHSRQESTPTDIGRELRAQAPAFTDNSATLRATEKPRAATTRVEKSYRRRQARPGPSTLSKASAFEADQEEHDAPLSIPEDFGDNVPRTTTYCSVYNPADGADGEIRKHAFYTPPTKPPIADDILLEYHAAVDDNKVEISLRLVLPKEAGRIWGEDEIDEVTTQVEKTLGDLQSNRSLEIGISRWLKLSHKSIQLGNFDGFRMTLGTLIRDTKVSPDKNTFTTRIMKQNISCSSQVTVRGHDEPYKISIRESARDPSEWVKGEYYTDTTSMLKPLGPGSRAQIQSTVIDNFVKLIEKQASPLPGVKYTVGNQVLCEVLEEGD